MCMFIFFRESEIKVSILFDQTLFKADLVGAMMRADEWILVH